MNIYSKILEDGLMPAYYFLRGRSYDHCRKFLEQSQWWPGDRVAEYQWGEVQNLLRHAFNTVPFYKEKFGAAGAELGDIKTPADFAKLPTLSRAEVNEYRAHLCSNQYPPSRLISHATGGSSGQPTRFYLTTHSYDWRSAASARAYSYCGYRLGQRCLYLWGAAVGHVPAWKSAKKRAYHSVRRELVFSTFSQTDELWKQIFTRALRFRPRFIVGYVSSLEQFARFLLANGLSIPAPRAIIAAAEPVYKTTRDLLSSALGAPVFNTYGSREFMSIAAECDQHDGLHINAENLFVETEQADSPSELLITDLHNYGMPLIRYRIGDLGVLSNSPCLCGRGLPMIHAIEGRLLDVLRTRDGRIVPGEVFPHIIKDIPEISEFLVEQKTLDQLELTVVLKGNLSSNSQALLCSEFTKAFGDTMKVDIKRVDVIPRRPSGKRRVTVGLAQ